MSPGPKAKPIKRIGSHRFPGLWVKWSKSERDLLMFHDKHSPDGRLLHSAFNCVKVCDERSLTEELDRRGFDLTTLKFSIERKSEG